VPPDVVSHVQDTIRDVLPANAVAIRDRTSQVLIDTVRPHLDRETLETLLENDDLQSLLKEDEPFQDLVCGVLRMNQAGRSYFLQEPLDNVSGVRVLHSVLSSSSTDSSPYMHLRENPSLCLRFERQSRKRTATTSE
jgi:hypothetical protein